MLHPARQHVRLPDPKGPRPHHDVLAGSGTRGCQLAWVHLEHAQRSVFSRTPANPVPAMMSASPTRRLVLWDSAFTLIFRCTRAASDAPPSGASLTFRPATHARRSRAHRRTQPA
jgi:hypothetical protein